MSPAPTNKASSKTARTVRQARPARPVEVRLPYLRKSMASQIDGGFRDKAVRTADKILALSPESTSVVLTKVSLLLHLDKYTRALALLDSDALATSQTGFERSYCLYKLGRETEAEEVLQQARADGGDGAEMLEAQLAFRRHDYATASDIYTSLASHFPDSNPASVSLNSNLALTDSLTEFVSSGYLDALREAEDTLDIDDLEESVPHVPVASGSTLPAATDSKPKSAPRKRRHALPKGAVEAEAGAFQEDSERWIPLRARTIPAAPLAGSSAKKGPAKGKKEGMGTGMTQGSVSSAPVAGGGAGTGGGKKKKGKK